MVNTISRRRGWGKRILCSTTWHNTKNLCIRQRTGVNTHIVNNAPKPLSSVIPHTYHRITACPKIRSGRSLSFQDSIDVNSSVLIFKIVPEGDVIPIVLIEGCSSIEVVRIESHANAATTWTIDAIMQTRVRWVWLDLGDNDLLTCIQHGIDPHRDSKTSTIQRDMRSHDASIRTIELKRAAKLTCHPQCISLYYAIVAVTTWVKGCRTGTLIKPPATDKIRVSSFRHTR